MGVMKCDRKGCERILCDRYSKEYGYICDECFEELVSLGAVDVSTFMQIPKGITFWNVPASREYFSSIFKRRNDGYTKPGFWIEPDTEESNG